MSNLSVFGLDVGIETTKKDRMPEGTRSFYFIFTNVAANQP
jgi:hypothetical protein